MRFHITCLLLFLFVTGCTSFQTTIMNRAPQNCLYPNQKKTTGVPVRLKVPSHVEAVVTEKFYVESTTAPGQPIHAREIPVCEIDQKGEFVPVRHMSVDTKIIYTDKVFTIDLQRPAGGLLETEALTFDEEQYVQQLKAKYEEKTLEQVNTAIGKLKPAIKNQAKSGPLSNAGLIERERMLAVARYDISTSTWEDELNLFVNSHLGTPHVVASR